MLLSSSHPLPPLLGSQVCSLCVSIAALQIGSSVQYFYICCVCINVWYLFFSFWLTSLCIIDSPFIHLISTDSNVFLLWLSNIPLCTCTTASLSSVSRHLGCFHVLLLLLLSCFSRVWVCVTHRRQPTRLRHPWDSPGKNTGVGCHFLLQCMKVKSESEVAQSCLTLATPWTAAYQASPSMGFSRQEYWSGVPLPSPPPCPSYCK